MRCVACNSVLETDEIENDNFDGLCTECSFIVTGAIIDKELEDLEAEEFDEESDP